MELDVINQIISLGGRNAESSGAKTSVGAETKFSNAEAVKTVPKITSNTEIKVTKDIRSGPATLAQKTYWRKFWRKIIAEVTADDSR